MSAKKTIDSPLELSAVMWSWVLRGFETLVTLLGDMAAREMPSNESHHVFLGQQIERLKEVLRKMEQ